MKGKKKEHEWDYMGWDSLEKKECSYCNLCKSYRLDNTILPKETYLDRYNKGLIKFN